MSKIPGKCDYCEGRGSQRKVVLVRCVCDRCVKGHDAEELEDKLRRMRGALGELWLLRGNRDYMSVVLRGWKLDPRKDLGWMEHGTDTD